MNSKKIFLVKFVILILFFLIVDFAFSQVKKEEKVFYSGTITSISGDYGLIVVSGENILISPDTRVFNEKGGGLKVNDLKPQLYVEIEGVPNPKGFLARKIVVKKPPEV